MRVVFGQTDDLRWKYDWLEKKNLILHKVSDNPHPVINAEADHFEPAQLAGLTSNTYNRA